MPHDWIFAIKSHLVKRSQRYSIRGKLQDPPTFDPALKPVTLTEGENLHLSCHVHGSPPMKIQWMKDRKDLKNTSSSKISFADGGQEAKLEIREVTKSDSGQYRCVATNKNGEIECNTDMHVEEKKEVTGVEGDFRAKLKKTPSKQKSPQKEKDIDIVELLRNVDPKEYEKYARMYGITDYRGLLQAIEQLKREKAEETGKTPSPGEGRGRGLKPGGGGGGGDKPPDANPFGFQLKAVPLKFTRPLKDIVLQEGDAVGASATFECEVSPSTAVTTWMKDGSNLRESPKHKFTSDGKDRRLAIIDVQLVDTGEYTCVAKLGNKEKTTTAKLIVEDFFVLSTEESLKIIVPLEDCDTQELKTVRFSCKVNRQKATLKWTKAGQEITFSKRIIYRVDQYKHTLTIKDCTLADEGEYTAIAGDDKCTAEMIISEAPTDFSTMDQSLVTDAGKPIVMFVPYSAYPKAEAEWFYDNVSLPKDNIHTVGDRTEYRLKDPKKSDQGRYKVVIKNKHGQGEAFINLDVIDVPGPVKILQVLDTADGEVSLAWEEPESDGGSKIITYVVERRDIKRKTWTLATDRSDAPEYTVTGLQRESMYLFRVSARNRVGSGPNIETEKPGVYAKNKFGKQNISYCITSYSISFKFGATVSWEKPVSDGGAEITTYIIESRDRTSVKWAVAMISKATDRSAIINDVIENKEYIFRVKAENKAGIGKPSAATNPRPSPPQNLVPSEQNKNSVQLTWETPLKNGGSMITGYIIERCEDETNHWLRCNARLFGPTMDLSGFKDGLEVIVPHPLTIRVPISGYPTPHAKWSFADKELTAGERVYMITKSTYVELTVTPIVRPDRGVYALTLENDITSCSGEIEVNVIGKWRDEPCGKTQHTTKILLSLRLQVTGLIEGQWYAYRVKALNRLGASKPCKATDEILAVDPKEILLDVKCLAGLTVKAGSKIELPADVHGKPLPKVKWTKGDVVLKGDDRVSIDDKPGHSVVTISKTTREDTATYIIEAHNSCGRATATIDVNILGTLFCYLFL
uniref:Immunoglobulin superfamily member 22 n=1 Tax=Hucho hucho TaxID=62062 RepID=A0A4W5MQW6_9TELE